MSTDGGSTKPVGATYDVADIRGRMVVCFSLAELRQLAEDLGATGIAWERGTGEAARELCRILERRGDIGALIARLKEVRPLVEWPETDPGEPPVELPVIDTILATSVEGSPAADAAALPSEVYDPIAPPTDDELDEDAEATLLRPGGLISEAIAAATQPSPPAPTAPAEAPAGPPINDPYASPSAGGAAWPGTMPVQPAKPESRGLDPRILLGVAGLMVLAVGIAYVAGRASTPPSVPTATSASASAAPPARRPEGLATRAADAIGRRLVSVARACEVQPSPAEDVMQRVVARCGRETISAPSRPRGLPPPDPTDAPPPPPPPPARPLPRPVSVPGAAPVAENAGCLGGCDRQHKACKSSQCGSEPTEGSKYKAYQDCLSKCLIEASRCRLSCQQ